MMVFFALLLGLGVLFGSGAMVVDLGYGMVQQGAMQNAADAGALAAGKLMAGSVSIDGSGNPVYVLTDNQVHQQVASLVVDNFQGTIRMSRDPRATDNTYALHTTWLNTTSFTAFELTALDQVTHVATWRLTSSHQLAVEYLACPGKTSGTPNFTARSDQDVVTALGGTRLSSALADHEGVGSAPDWNWPNPICMLRVSVRESHAPFLASLIPGYGNAPMREMAQATVRIAPTAAPTDISDVWPITAWQDPSKPATVCAFTPGSPCTFWDSNGAPGGKFKSVVNLNRYSALHFPTPRPEQHFNCFLIPVTGPCYDPDYPGSQKPDGTTLSGNDIKTDLTNWFTNGWHGHLYINESDPNCTAPTTPTQIVRSCQNSRLELFNGDGGANVAGAMRDYINAHPEGIDPSCNCNYATLVVFFWSYADDTSCPTGPADSCVVDPGQAWSGGNANTVQTNGRVILQKARRFRFNTSSVAGSSASGYYVSFYDDTPPTADAPPSGIANTVTLVG